MSATVELNADDFAMILHLAAQRSVESLRSNRTDRLFEKNWLDAHKVHVLGALGEIAFAKWYGVYPGCRTMQFSGMAADVGEKYEIRHRYSNGHDLILREDTYPDRIYVLTRGVPPVIEIAGWCHGYEFSGNVEFSANHGGHGDAIFVPAEKLHDPKELLQ